MKNKIIPIILIIILLIPNVSAIEIRGTVAKNLTDIPSWDAYNFAGFFYDLDEDIGKETLSLSKPLLNYSITRTIPEGELTYSTGKTNTKFIASDQTGKLVNNKLYYQKVGWQAEEWVALNGNTNKLAKLIYEMPRDDKKTLISGNEWKLGSGYTLLINAVDASTTPRQAWVTLMKDYTTIDEGIVDTNTVYYKTKTILNTDDTLVFSMYIESIFSGETSDMIQIKYAWLIDEDTATEIKPSNKVGVFEVKEANADTIKLINSNPISLSKNSETTLMGNLNFRIADSDDLRFYPKIDYIVTTRSIEIQSPQTIVTIQTPLQLPIPESTTTIQSASVQSTIITESTNTLSKPITSDKLSMPIDYTFIIAITGLIIVAFIVIFKSKSST